MAFHGWGVRDTYTIRYASRNGWSPWTHPCPSSVDGWDRCVKIHFPKREERRFFSFFFISPFLPDSRNQTRYRGTMTVELFGSQGSRSPMVNWYLYEIKTPFQMAPRERNPHPFGQLPCLKDGDIEVPTTTFEFFSGFVHMVNINVTIRYSRAGQSSCILPRNTVVSALPKKWRRSQSGWCGQTPLSTPFFFC